MSKILIACFDTETTGLDPATEHVVQMSCVAYHPGDYASVVEFNALANPGVPMHPKAVEAHGITPSMLQGKPSSVKVVQAWWDSLVKHAAEQQAQIVLAGHNVNGYDVPLLRKYFPMGWPDLPIIDTLTIARRLYPSAKNHQLGFLVGEYHGLSPELAARAHDGLADCYMVAKLLTLYQDATQKSWHDLAEWTATPHRLSLVPFGKNKGRPFTALPERDLHWFMRQPGMDRDVLLTVREVLGV